MLHGKRIFFEKNKKCYIVPENLYSYNERRFWGEDGVR